MEFKRMTLRTHAISTVRFDGHLLRFVKLGMHARLIDRCDIISISVNGVKSLKQIKKIQVMQSTFILST